ncbi:MAG: amidohydrolase family protein [Acidobacteria bacterium]|nr:amidohydrolase family protein [Acidobacteriota bacterium]
MPATHRSNASIRIADPQWSLLAALLLAAALPAAGQEMTVEAYEPRSTLKVPGGPVTRAKFAFVDAHGHLRGSDPARIDQMVKEMDKMNMAVFVNLSGGSGERLKANIAATKGRYPGRFVVYANVDFSGIGQPGWGKKAAAQLEADFKAGAQGLKIYKNLSMFQTDSDGKRVAADDPRIAPVWEKAGELGIPVLIHVGEPSPFWDPWDEHNERWLELKMFPNRRRDDPARFASFEQTMSEQHNLFRNHPNTTFINAHLGWFGNDLARLGKLLDELPNVYTELGAVLAELGRQPITGAAFMEKYQDRVLMGKDSWDPIDGYHVYFRVLETRDEYFDYYRKRHAHWKMYGLGLSDEVLEKVYFRNALKIIPGLDRSLFPE